MIWILIAAIVFAIFLIVCENLAHDCAPGRNPTHKLHPPESDDTYLERVMKIRQMVHDNSKYIIWRQALILSIILPIFIVYYLKGRLPTFFELIVVGLIVFIGAYASYIWMWSRYFYPNTARMEKTLFELEERLREEELDSDVVTDRDIKRKYVRDAIRVN